MIKEIFILGTKYSLERKSPKEDEALLEFDGYCDDSVKKIVVSNHDPQDVGTKADMEAVRKKQIRHEIIHAFLSESGLAENSAWAQDEEIVDWIAIQGPKFMKAWEEAEAFD